MISTMEKKQQYPEIDMDAVMDAVLPEFRPTTKVAVQQRTCGIYIYMNCFDISIDSLISISMALYGRHNSLEVSALIVDPDLKDEYSLCLEGGVYGMLPKYYDCKKLVRKASFLIKHDPNE